MGVRERQPAPVLLQGSKTLAFETVEQLGWSLPDRIVCPIASGSLFTKLARGFSEWIELGLVEGELPTFNGAQAEGCSPVATAFGEGWDVCKPQRPDTIAKSLAIGDPADGLYALELARGTGGAIDSVTDDEIRDGIRLLAETTGIFTETAGGVTIAVLAKLAERGDIDPAERVVAYITGEGLKTLDATRDELPHVRDRTDARGIRVRAGADAPLAKVPPDASHRQDPARSSVPSPTAKVRSRSRVQPSARLSTRSSTSTTTCGSGSPRTAAYADSSTSTSRARTSGFKTGSRRSSATATR